MLHLKYTPGDLIAKEEKLVRYPSTRFSSLFKEEWLEEDWAERAVREIDHIPPEKSIHQALWDRRLTYMQLSGGVKMLLLIRHTDGVFALERMGHNCFPYLMEIADMREVYVCMEYVHEELDDSVIQGRAFEYVNTGTIMHTHLELVNGVYRIHGTSDS